MKRFTFDEEDLFSFVRTKDDCQTGIQPDFRERMEKSQVSSTYSFTKMILRTLPNTLAKEMASVSTGIILGKSIDLRKALWAAWSAADFGLSDKPHLDSRKDLLFAAFSGIKWIARKEEVDRKTLRKATVRIMDLIREESIHEENWNLLKGRSICAVSDVSTIRAWNRQNGLFNSLKRKQENISQGISDRFKSFWLKQEKQGQ